MKILNLYAGIGGNRKLWNNGDEVTAIEINEEIAGVYKYNFPKDNVIVTDSHEYLLRHYNKFDFIWSSPPCPTHSRLNFSREYKCYPNMTVYQQIILLNSWFKGKWVIENVLPYYDALIKPNVELGRHVFWSNFNISKKEFTNIDVSRSNQEQLSKDLDMPIPRLKPRLLLRNCVNPKIGEHIYNCAFKLKQKKIN
jgi:DNA (cytosine-5)-methyltransferase 1